MSARRWEESALVEPETPSELYCWRPRREESDCDRTLLRKLRASVRAAKRENVERRSTRGAV